MCTKSIFAAFGVLAMLTTIEPRPVQSAGWEKYIPKGPGRTYYNRYGKPWVDRYAKPKRFRKSRSKHKVLRGNAVVLYHPPPPPHRNVRRTKPRWKGGYVY